MDCKEIQERLPEYMAEDLDAAVMNTFRAHIDGCEECRKEAAAYEKTWNALDAWEDYEPSPAFKPVMPVDEKKLSFKDWFLSLFSFRIPAWATAMALMLAFSAGHYLLPGPAGTVEESRIVYVEVEKPDTGLVDFSILGGDNRETGLPRTTDVISLEDRNRNDGEKVDEAAFPSAEWDSGDKLERIDVESVFHI